LPKHYQTYITATAESEMYADYQWIDAEAPHNAAKWFAGLFDAIASLESFPERCPLAPENDMFEEEIRVHLYRMSSVYRILFTIQDDRVVVLYVRHSARQPVAPESRQ
jgi:plasmid stabilization system protein ParE